MSFPPMLLEDWANEYAAENRWERFDPVHVYCRRFFSDCFDVYVSPGFVGRPVPDGGDERFEARYTYDEGVLKPRADLDGWQDCGGRPAPFLVTRPIMRRLNIVPACWIFALPGMGKTSFVAKYRYAAPIYDVDYGSWRRREGVPSKWDMTQHQYREALRRFMDYVRDLAPCPGPHYPWIPVFLCNELDLIPFALAMGHEVGMLLPADEFQATWIDGIIRRAESRASWAPYDYDVGEDERAFAQKAAQRRSCWMEDWKAAAVGWSLPVQLLNHYISEGDIGILRQGCQLSPALRELAARGASTKR